MPVNYPKFDKKIQDQIDLAFIKSSKTRPGIIMGYDRKTGMATVALDDAYSSAVGNIIRSVPCPVTRGIQLVDPIPGTRCVVGFRDNNESQPYVLNYFNDTANRTSNIYNNYVNTGIPKFMVD